MKKHIQFVKMFGVEVSKDLSKRETTSIGYLSVEHHKLNQEHLKQIVDAFEFVEKNNGLNASKNTLKLLQSSIDIGLNHGINDVDAKTEIPKLKQAIELVEKCNASD